MATSAEVITHDQSQFEYDYDTLRTTGVILAVIMFVGGILIALSKYEAGSVSICFSRSLMIYTLSKCRKWRTSNPLISAEKVYIQFDEYNSFDPHTFTDDCTPVGPCTIMDKMTFIRSTACPVRMYFSCLDIEYICYM
ncbi:UNVERIFIED_CONTAM: hypothetical protein FKN15_073295 [Acipenser sinensis]